MLSIFKRFQSSQERSPSGSPPIDESPSSGGVLRPRNPIPAWVRGEEPGSQSRRLGSYLLGPRLGSGGAGDVFEAWDLTLRRSVAIKILRGTHPQNLIRFMREAQAQAGLCHRAIARVFEVHSSSNQPYIVMQLIQGKTLDQFKESLDPLVIAGIMEEVAQALQTAHDVGLIHRDLKPGNIMLEPGPDGQWNPYILDFGLAVEANTEGSRPSENASGTPAFMAPEQIWNQGVDPRTDLYALGATMFFMLSGRPPYDGTTLAEIRTELESDQRPPLRSLRPDIPRGLEAILNRCLHIQPEERFESAAHLAEALRLFRRHHKRELQAWQSSTPLQRFMSLPSVRMGLLILLSLLSLSLGTMAYRSIRARRSLQAAGPIRGELREVLNSIDAIRALPVHDIRPEMSALRRQLQIHEKQILRLPPTESRELLLQMGNIYLKLRDFSLARHWLELARKAGLDTPDFHYAQTRLGTLLTSVHDRLWLAQAKRNKILDPGQISQTQAHLRMLLASPSSQMAYPLLPIMKALMEDQEEEARHAAQLLQKRQPWLGDAFAYECLTLRRMDEKWRSKHQDRPNPHFLEQAAAVMGKATEMARSDDYFHAVLLYMATGAFHRYAELGPVPPPLLSLLKASTQRALNIQPESPLVLDSAQLAAQALAQHALTLEQDPASELESTQEWMPVLASVHPALFHQHSAQTLYLKAQQAERLGQAVLPLLDAADQHLSSALESGPIGPELIRFQVKLLLLRSQASMAAGQNPLKELKRALELSEEHLRLRPDSYLSHLAQGMCYSQMAWAQAKSGTMDWGLFQKAQSALEHSMHLAPEACPPRLALARTLGRMAQYKPQEALNLLNQGLGVIQLEGCSTQAEGQLVLTSLLLGLAEAEHGHRPHQHLTLARMTIQKHLLHHPKHVHWREMATQCSILEAAAAHRKRGNPQPK